MTLQQRLRADFLNRCRSAVTKVASDATFLTFRDLEGLMENTGFIEPIFGLFQQENPSLETWLKTLSFNLGIPQDSRFVEFFQLVESVTLLRDRHGEGILSPTLLHKIFSSPGIPKLLFQSLIQDGETTVSTDALMMFLMKATSPRWQQHLSPDDVEKFIAYFRKYAGSQQSVDREGFRKIISTKNEYFSERIFTLADQNQDNRVCVDEYTELMTKLSATDEKGMIEFLFRIFDSDDDGRLGASDIAQALQASLAANKMAFEKERIRDLVEALFDDVGLRAHKDFMLLDNWHALLIQHEGLVEGLMQSMTSLILPPEESGHGGNKTRNPGFSWLGLRQYVASKFLLLSFLAVIFAVNAFLFVFRLIAYSTFQNWWGGVNVMFMFSRANGLCLNFNAMLVLAMVLRHTLTYLRRLGFGAFLPLDHHIYLHKVVGITIFIQAWIHSIMHLINLKMNVVPPHTNDFIALNEDFLTDIIEAHHVQRCHDVVNLTQCRFPDYSMAQWLFTNAPGAFGLYPGMAFPSGLVLIVVVTFMFVCSLPFVRRSGHFEVFYFSHLLYVVFYGALLLHAPACYKWTCVPIVLFLWELLFRLLSLSHKMSRGVSTIQAGLILPSKVTALVIKTPDRFKFSPGDWVFVKIPRVAQFEWHPFTISSAPEESESFTLHIRAVGGWTKKLYHLISSTSGPLEKQLASEDDTQLMRRYSRMRRRPSMVRYSQQQHSLKSPKNTAAATEMMERGDNGRMGEPLTIYIDGPYGAPASNIFRAQHAVLIATGIGVTPFSSILQSIMHRFWAGKTHCPHCSKTWTDGSKMSSLLFNLSKVDFFWINRDQRSFEWIVDLLSQLEMEQAEESDVDHRFLDMHMYITTALQKHDMRAIMLSLAMDLNYQKEKRDLITGLKSRTKYGRPDWNAVFQDLKNQNKGDISVFYCGNPALARSLRKKCREFGFKFYKEVF